MNCLLVKLERKQLTLTNRIDNAKDENEVWKVAKEIINPVKENNFSMKVNDVLTDDPKVISDGFNSFFVKKIEDLKANIDPNLVKDPLDKLRENMKKKDCKFELKTVSTGCVFSRP